MSSELVCKKHGPYSAQLGQCPYCAQEAGGGRPPEPMPLDYEGETHIPPYQGRSNPAEEFGEGKTGIPGGRGADRFYREDEETELPKSRGGRYVDDIEETEIPRRHRGSGELDDEEGLDVTQLDREDTSLLGWLVVKKGDYMRRGQIMKIKPGQIMGRDPRRAHVVIDDEKVSGLHARIKVKEDKFILVDLGSVNGTSVNGEEILAPRVLEEGDEIKIGDTLFVIKLLQ